MLPPNASYPDSPALPSMGGRSSSTALVPTSIDLPVPLSTGAPLGSPARPPALSSGPGLSELWHALRRRMPLALGLGSALGAIIAACVFIFLPTNVEVTAYLEAKRLPQSILTSHELRGDPAEFAVFKQTISQILVNPFVITAALNRPGISNLSLIKEQADPVQWLQDNVKVPPTDGEVVLVSLKTDRPVQAADILNAIVDSFMEEYIGDRKRQSKSRLQVLENKRTETNSDINKNRTVLEKIQQDLGTTEPEMARMRHQNLTNELANLRGQLTLAENEKLEADILARDYQFQIETYKPAEIDDATIESYINNDIQMRTHQETLLRTRLERDAVLAVLSDNRHDDSRLQQYDLRISSIEEALEARRVELRQAAQQLTQTNNLELLKTELQRVENKRGLIENRLKELRTAIEAKTRETDSFGRNSATLEHAKREDELLTVAYTTLDQEMRALQIEQDAPDRVRVFQRAVVPPGAGNLLRFVLIGFSGVLGLAIGMMAVSFWEYQHRRLSSSNEISEGLGLRVVGALPGLHSVAWRRSKRKGGDVVQSMLSESINSIRAALLHNASQESTRVVMITSAGHGEGKTTLASQLAASIARAGRRTLLIDGDLRAPSINRLFELPLDPGLCEVLRGEAALEDVIRPTRANGLWLIPAGNSCRESIEALSKPVARELFDRMRPNFDFIIMDAGPVLPVADSLLLGQCVDAAILTVLRDISRIPKVYEAYERLQSVGIRVMGVVMGGMADSGTEGARKIPARASA